MPPIPSIASQIDQLGKAAIKVSLERVLPNQTFFEEKQRSLENWIVIELGLGLAKTIGKDAVNFEVAYPKNTRNHCDMVISAGERRLWIEVAHVWNWSQSKWKNKCERDVKRLQDVIKKHPSDHGCLLLFLLSPESMVNLTVRNWAEQQMEKTSIKLIDISSK